MRLPRVSLGIAALMMLASATSCQAQPKVTIATRDGREIGFHVEIADTPGKREMGLQYRRELAADRGMIFLFPAESPQSFWMKNTALPLDMIFIDRQKKIVGVVERTTPFSLEPRSVPGASQFVLEINAGLSQKHGFRAGDSVRFDGFSADAVRE